MDSENNFISGIFNYCDRWCERCDFTARCRVFAMEAEMKAGGYDGSIESTVQIVSNSMGQAKEMLIENAEKMGIDLEAAANDPEIEESIERVRRKVEDQYLFKLSRKYALDIVQANQLFETLESGAIADDPTVVQMIEIINWYRFFITVKIHSALHSLLDLDGEEEPEALSDAQSDANGRAKVALMAIERSILAWTYVLTETNASMIRPFIVMLEEIGRMIEEKFPNARSFVRPGFDEIETVM